MIHIVVPTEKSILKIRAFAQKLGIKKNINIFELNKSHPKETLEIVKNILTLERDCIVLTHNPMVLEAFEVFWEEKNYPYKLYSYEKGEVTERSLSCHSDMVFLYHELATPYIDIDKIRGRNEAQKIIKSRKEVKE